MSNQRIRSLFHTLVVVGASVSACGGKSSSANREHEPSGGVGGVGGAGGSAASSTGGARSGAGAGGQSVNAGGTGGSPEGPFTTCIPSQWKCDSYFPAIACRCDESLPLGPESCSSKFDFTCDSESFSAGISYGIGCSCEPGALTPDDCDRSEQFSCNHYGSFFANCVCDPGAPLTPVDCEGHWCTEFSCESEMPRYGCKCRHLGCIK